MKASNSNKSQLPFKKQKPSAAEILFIRKHDEAVAVFSTIGHNSHSRERKGSNSNKIKLNPISTTALSARSVARDTNIQGEVQSSMSNSILPRVGISERTSSLPNVKMAKDKHASRVLMKANTNSPQEQQPQQHNLEHEQDWMVQQNDANLINRQLLLQQNNSSEESSSSLMKNNTRANDSMTSQMFNFDKMQHKDGGMAMQPLGMETVMESKDERLSQNAPLRPVMRNNMNRERTEAAFKHMKKGRLNQQTTEKNIAMQQQLDLSTVEDFLFMPKKQLSVIEDDVTEADYEGIRSPTKQQQRLAFSPNLIQMNNSQSKMRLGLGVCMSTPNFKPLKLQNITEKKAHLVKKQSSRVDKKTNVVSIVKKENKEFLDSTRNLHAGLQKVMKRVENKQNDNASRDSILSKHTDFSQALQFSDRTRQKPAEFTSICKEISSIESGGGDTNTKKSQQSMVIPEFMLRQSTTQTEIAQKANKTIGCKLYLKPTSNNSKNLATNLRNLTSANSAKKFKDQLFKSATTQEKIMKVDKIMIKSAVIGNLKTQHMHRRMKSQASFNEERQQLQQVIQTTVPELQNNKVMQTTEQSKLVTDYKMHIKNRACMQTLMKLMGKNKMEEKSNTNDVDKCDIESISTINDSLKNDGYSNSITPMIGSLDLNSKNTKFSSTKFGSALDQIGQVSGKTFTDFAQTYGSSIDASSQDQSVTNYIMIETNAENTPQDLQTSIDNIRTNYHVEKGKYSSQRNVRIEDQMAKSSYGTTGLGLFNQDRKQLKQLNTINMKNERQVLFFDKTESSHDHLSIMMPRTSPHAQEDQNSYSHTISIKDHCKTARGHLQKIGGSSHLGYNPSNSQMTKSMSLKNKLKQIDGSCSQFVAQVGAMSTMPSVRNSTNNSQNKNLGKQFVLVKGKAQHCEKYILNDLQPYSQIQTNSKTTTASSKIRNPNRKSLMLQQMNSKNQQSMNPQYQNSHKKGKARGNKIRRKTTKGRKGSNSIMEEEGEHSSQDETTWQDFRNQNQELKDQILNQIAIFQQYLKVAVLQHKSQQAEEERYQKRSPQFSKRHVSVDNHVLVTNRDFQFDVKGEIQSSGGAKEMQMALDRQNVRTGVVPIQRMRKMQSGMNRGLPPISDNQYMTNQNKDKFLSLTRHASVETLRCSGSADNNSKNSRSILKAQKKIQNKASVKSFDTSSAIGITASEYQQTFQINNSTIGRKSQKMKALRYLIPHSQLNDSAQAQWVQKIKKLWKKLNKHENDEVSKLEDEIKENKAHIKKLSLNNLYELDTNANDQKILTKVQGKKKKVDKNLKSNSDVKKIRKLQDRVRKELQRKVEFNTWGFHNYIISYRIKCRLTEDVIDCAQRVSIKSDEKTQRELSILKQLRDRTDEDLRIFVERREKQPWRLWDRYHVFGYGHDFKPSLQNHEITFIELTEQIDNDLKSISYLETSYSQLRLDIPYYNQINCEMIKFITDVFGNAGWLQLFSLKLLRKQQEDEQHVKQYMPPVDQIKMFEVDPYTLQVEASSADNQIRQTNIQIVPVKKLSGYELRKPDQPTQNTLKTGYEPRITTINENNKLNSSAAPASETVLVHDNNVTPEQDQAIKSEEEKKKSTWLETLKKEGIEKEVREQKEKKARAARLAVLFQAEEVLNEKDVWDINNEENDHEILDLCAAKGRISSYMDKIDTHLQVEKRLLEAWQHIDSQDQKVEKKIVPASVEAQGPLE